jgi:uncharacterized membrane protein
MSTFSRAAALAAVLACVGCGADFGGGVLIDQTPTTTPSSPTESDDRGFPCDVQAMLETSCAPCHAGNMYVVALTTRDIWLSPRSNGTPYGQYAADQVAAAKMPPPTAMTQPSSGDRALLAAWVAAGMSAGPCGPLTPPAR